MTCPCCLPRPCNCDEYQDWILEATFCDLSITYTKADLVNNNDAALRDGVFMPGLNHHLCVGFNAITGDGCFFLDLSLEPFVDETTGICECRGKLSLFAIDLPGSNPIQSYFCGVAYFADIVDGQLQNVFNGLLPGDVCLCGDNSIDVTLTYNVLP